MNYLDLFSGIGGFALGAYQAGFRCKRHYFSEVEPYAIKVYEKRFPDAVGLGDIRYIKGSDLPKGNWIITAGFPCQDISYAGKGAGLEGERSGLWFECLRLIDEIRPEYAILENVGALTRRGLNRVLGGLSEIGYDAEWQDIRASDVGAPHKRERIWIVGYPSGCGCRGITWGRPGSVPENGYPQMEERTGMADTSSTGLPERGQSRRNTGAKERKTGLESKLKRCSIDVPDTNIINDVNPRYGTGKVCRVGQTEAEISGDMANSTGKRWREGITERKQGISSGGFPHTNIERCEKKPDRITDKPEIPYRRYGEVGGHWAIEPNVGRVAHGVPSRVDRLKGLGNSIVPQIVELIFRQIFFLENTDKRSKQNE